MSTKKVAKNKKVVNKKSVASKPKKAPVKKASAEWLKKVKQIEDELKNPTKIQEQSYSEWLKDAAEAAFKNMQVIYDDKQSDPDSFEECEQCAKCSEEFLRVREGLDKIINLYSTQGGTIEIKIESLKKGNLSKNMFNFNL